MKQSWPLVETMKRRHPNLYDKEATEAAHFDDPRSYIKRSKDGELLTYLFGVDMTALRKAAFERSKGFCEVPIHGFNGHRCNRNVDWETAELHHAPPKSQGGDDSLASVLISCRRCHVAAHNRVTKFTNRSLRAQEA